MQRIKLNNEERVRISKVDIGQKLIVNNKPAAVVRSISNDAAVATKIDEKTIEIMCYEGGELLLQRTMADGMPICEYGGVRDYVHDLSSIGGCGIGNQRFEYYNEQLKSYTLFVPFT